MARKAVVADRERQGELALTRWSLDVQMRTVLMRLELLSHGSTQAWNASGGHSGEPDDRTITMVLVGDEPPHLRYRRLYGTATTDEARIRIVTEAETELTSWLRRKELPKTTISLVDLILEDGKGYEPDLVARRYGVDAAFVRRQRARKDLDTETGEKAAAVDRSDKPAKARELRKLGMSTRQIAFMLDASQSAVMNWTRRTA
jgi:transposase